MKLLDARKDHYRKLAHEQGFRSRAAYKLKELNQKEESMETILNKVIEVAKEGMLSTKELIATKGRASFLGERAKGHIDPGARSSQIMITTVCESVINS